MLVKDREKETEEQVNRQAKYLMMVQLNFKNANQSIMVGDQKEAEAIILQQRAEKNLDRLVSEENELKSSLQDKTMQIEQKLKAAQDELKKAHDEGNELRIEASERVLKMILEEKEKTTKDLKQMRSQILVQQTQLNQTKEEVGKFEQQVKQSLSTIGLWKRKIEEAKKEAAEEMIERDDKIKQFKDRIQGVENKLAQQKNLVDMEEKASESVVQDAILKSKEAGSKLQTQQHNLIQIQSQAQMAQNHFYMSSNFSNLWLGGQTGVSQFTFSVSSAEKAVELVKSLMQKRLIAEVTQQDNSTQKLTQEGTLAEVKVTGVTSDVRVPELVETVARFQKNDTQGKSDVIILPVNTGSSDYIKWVKDQTDPSAAHPTNNQVVEVDSQNTDEKDDDDDDDSDDDDDDDDEKKEDKPKDKAAIQTKEETEKSEDSSNAEQKSSDESASD